MKEKTREWLADLATIKNNTKAKEILTYIEHLEAKIKNDPITASKECGAKKPSTSKPAIRGVSTNPN